MIRPAFFSIGFRPFFASGILFAALALLAWGNFWQLNSEFSILKELSPWGGPLFWHPHELIMGFAVAIIIGFLLTAVRNWTGLETAPPIGIFILWCLWILARITMAFSSAFEFSSILFIQISPMVLAAFFIGKPIIQKRLWRNLFAPAILLAFAALDACMLLAMRASQEIPTELFYTSVLLIAFVITMIGGRIIPFFSANKLQIPKPEEHKALLLASALPLLLLAALQLMPANSTTTTLSTLCAVVLTISHSMRLKLWFHKGMLFHPMLWSLWLFYGALPLGFLFMSLPNDVINSSSVPIHIIAIGGICGLIISMVSRVSLGHTGRVITHDKTIVLAFILIILSLLARTLVMLLVGMNTTLIMLSALLAASSFILIFVRFIVIWATPRPDAS